MTSRNPFAANERIRAILEDLEAVRDNLLALSDDIWASIDHNDPASLEEGVEFKRAYNAKSTAFDAVATDLSTLVQQYTRVRLDADESSGAGDGTANDRIVAELNRDEKHSLAEDFTFKRPHGFVFDGQAASGIRTWRRMYELVCQQLLERDPARFRALTTNPDYISSRGNHSFSTDPSQLRSAMPIGDGYHAESNLSSNGVRDQLRRLLATFERPQESLAIYLRQDRDAGRTGGVSE